MTTVIARLTVDDFDTWHAEYERMHALREERGERGRTLYRDASDPHAVVVVFEWDSHEHARAYFDSPELHASVARAKGRAAPEVWYVNRT